MTLSSVRLEPREFSGCEQFSRFVSVAHPVTCVAASGLLMTDDNDNYYLLYHKPCLPREVYVDLFNDNDVGIDRFAAVGVHDIIFCSSKRQQR